MKENLMGRSLTRVIVALFIFSQAAPLFSDGSGASQFLDPSSPSSQPTITFEEYAARYGALKSDYYQALAEGSLTSEEQEAVRKRFDDLFQTLERSRSDRRDQILSELRDKNGDSIVDVSDVSEGRKGDVAMDGDGGIFKNERRQAKDAVLKGEDERRDLVLLSASINHGLIADLNTDGSTKHLSLVHKTKMERGYNDNRQPVDEPALSYEDFKKSRARDKDEWMDITHRLAKKPPLGEETVVAENARENRELVDLVNKSFSPLPGISRKIQEVPASRVPRFSPKEAIAAEAPPISDSPRAMPPLRNAQIPVLSGERKLTNRGVTEAARKPARDSYEVLSSVNVGPELAAVHYLLHPDQKLHPFLRLLLYRGFVTDSVQYWYVESLREIDRITQAAKEEKRKRIRYRGKVMDTFRPLPDDMGGSFELIASDDEAAREEKSDES
jgi:hypothetical protein